MCFYCGKVGHIEKGCGIRIYDVEHQSLKEGQYREWMKAVEGLQGLSWNSNSSPGLDGDQPSSHFRDTTAMNQSPASNRDSPGLTQSSVPKNISSQHMAVKVAKQGEGSSTGNNDKEMMPYEPSMEVIQVGNPEPLATVQESLEPGQSFKIDKLGNSTGTTVKRTREQIAAEATRPAASGFRTPRLSSTPPETCLTELKIHQIRTKASCAAS
ncbi:zinc knuckle (CCHC-type) family protein [Striga asiatica]|uniref:Zinc knuckle (CCHC-type) family protein n=1 Tax=Striga asiatica TaxID=4170 RepID=A0A5A7RGC0_STRAF|nr:zinc knuckle (CCHC-type) family protein [Striga asiatica]